MQVRAISTATAVVEAPGAVSSRPLYRASDAPSSSKAANIMHDRRVVRGSTYAQAIIAPSVAEELASTMAAEESRKRRRMAESRRRAEADERMRGTDLPPVAGRAHSEIQTETYLEAISDRPPEEEMGVQTEAAMDRPPAPLFIPAPSGSDVATQILPGDLFDFDSEVEPLLEVLVGRTLENALGEVVQEAELAAVRGKRAAFEAVRSAELAEVQRMEAEVRRRFAEKQRRKEQEAARLVREAAVREKVAAAAFSRSYLAVMRRNVFAALHASGHFADPLHREVARWLPAVYADVEEATGGVRAGVETLLEGLLSDALAAGAAKHAAHVQKLADEKAAAEAAIVAAAEAKAAAKARRLEEAAAAAAAEAAAEAAAAAAEEREGGEEEGGEE